MKYENIEKINEDLCPQSESFKWSPDYDSRDIQRDQNLLKARKRNIEYSERDRRSDSSIMETMFINIIDQDDWFREWNRYGNDPDFSAISSIPTSEEDDSFNHIDVISVISNRDTNHKPIPFAIDLTYNVDPNNAKSSEKLAKKFQWKHVYGKKPTAPNDVSEFGEIITETDYDGNSRTATRPLPLKYRYGMKIPGFAAAKYYQDAGSDYPKADQGCHIPIMPRFVVAFDPELSTEIANGEPDYEYARKYGESAFARRLAQYESAKSRAKWCMLTELTKQASDIREYLDNLPDEQSRWIDPREFATARTQITILEKYFDDALDANDNDTQDNPFERDGKQYAATNNICQTVTNFSTATYR